MPVLLVLSVVVAAVQVLPWWALLLLSALVMMAVRWFHSVPRHSPSFPPNGLSLTRQWREQQREGGTHDNDHTANAIVMQRLLDDVMSATDDKAGTGGGAAAALPPPRRLLLASTTELSTMLREGTITSTHLTKLFICHIQLVNKHINAMVHSRFEEALVEAARADAVLAQWRWDVKHSSRGSVITPPGWLTGIPCTMKECFHVTGCPVTVGHPMRKGYRASYDAVAVEQLRNGGAIILGLTNVSELCMWMETGNRVYGITSNPYDNSCTAGGSSGGEAAAVAALFAPFGLGADIGGSIRMPAYFNGIFGHKPSTRLVCNRGQHTEVSKAHFLLTVGPFSRHAQDLYPLLKTLTKNRGFDEDPALYPPCPPLQDPRSVQIGSKHNNNNNSNSTTKKSADTIRCVYYFDELPLKLVSVSNEQRDAVRHVVRKLKEEFHDEGVAFHKIDFKKPSTIPPGWEEMRNALPIWAEKIGLEPRGYLLQLGESYEEKGKRYRPFLELGKWLVGCSQHTLPSIGLGCIERIEKVVVPTWLKQRYLKKGEELQKAVFKALGNDTVLILPTFPKPAQKHHAPMLLPVQWQYTALFNAMETPSTAVPVWLPPEATSLRDKQRVPLGVQIVSNWGYDHLSLAMAEELERLGVVGYRPPSWVATE